MVCELHSADSLSGSPASRESSLWMIRILKNFKKNWNVPLLLSSWQEQDHAPRSPARTHWSFAFVAARWEQRCWPWSKPVRPREVTQRQTGLCSYLGTHWFLIFALQCFVFSLLKNEIKKLEDPNVKSKANNLNELVGFYRLNMSYLHAWDRKCFRFWIFLGGGGSWEYLHVHNEVSCWWDPSLQNSLMFHVHFIHIG